MFLKPSSLLEFFLKGVQSINWGILLGAHCLGQAIVPNPRVSLGKSPCHPKCLMGESTDLLKPHTFWASPWSPPIRIIFYRNNLVSKVDLQVVTSHAYNTGVKIYGLRSLMAKLLNRRSDTLIPEIFHDFV